MKAPTPEARELADAFLARARDLVPWVLEHERRIPPGDHRGLPEEIRISAIERARAIAPSLLVEIVAQPVGRPVD